MKNKLKLDQGVLSEMYCISQPPRIFFMTSSLRVLVTLLKLDVMKNYIKMIPTVTILN